MLLFFHSVRSTFWTCEVGVVSLPSERFTRFGNPAWPGVRTAYFAALGSWPGGALEERRKPSGQRCAYACRCPEGVAAPLGCVIFSVSVGIVACMPCAQGLSACARRGWYHYPRRALRAAETPDGRLPKGLICRFLRLPSSTPCTVTFSANTQISLSAISVANAFPPPTTAGLCASSRIASNRTTTVSLGCMDSSSFGCLIVLDSSSTYTTRS